MKIAIAASGSRGDVQPYVALGKGLREAGFSVCVLTSDDFQSLVTDAGLEFRSTGTSIESMLQTPEWRETTESGNFLKILAKMNAEMKHRANDLARTTLTLFDGIDLVLAGVGGMGGAFSIAEKFNLPIIQAYVFPITPTRAFPSPLTPTLPLGGMLNPLSFHAMRQMLWQTGRATDAIIRRELGLPRASLFGHYRALHRRRVPILYGYSQHVLPRPSDWSELNHVTGYWFLDPPDTWTPPAPLVNFMNAGTPPVYIGFGSMGNRDPEATTKIALKALEISGQRGVLASGWGGLHQADLPDTVYMLSSTPHSWLFPQMTAVVHHGGAGTTAAGLRAGVPTIITPFFGDQPFWGARVAALGVGTAPIPKRQLTAERLAQAVEHAVSDTGMRQRAAELGTRIRQENGTAHAAALIDQWALRSRPARNRNAVKSLDEA